jgi:Protein affecting phage T7 exclusion by the F plasmid
VIYVRYEGINTIKSGIGQILNNEMPIYEIISGAALAFAAVLMILPGFLTDFVGILIIFPPTRKLIFRRFTIKSKTINDKKIIDGEYEEKDDK